MTRHKMAGVEIAGLSKRYLIGNRQLFALEEINLALEHGSFTAVVGKSGCGKTTLLRLLSGLEEKTDGQITFTFDSNQDSAAARRVGIVFQEPRLMPWLTVKENIGFSLLKEKKQTSNEDVLAKYLQLLGLEPFKDAYPAQISGGMAQRVALGRALCYDPGLILMDEPFGALDYFTRKNLQNEMVNLFLSQKKTFVFVTHDVEEAVYLSQKVVVLNAGRMSGEFIVDLPYPRQTTSPQFLAVREQIYNAIMEVNSVSRV